MRTMASIAFEALKRAPGGLRAADIVPILYKGRTPPASAVECARLAITKAQADAAKLGQQIVCAEGIYTLTDGVADLVATTQHPAETIETIAQLRAEGMTARAIADRLGMSAKAVAGVLGGVAARRSRELPVAIERGAKAAVRVGGPVLSELSAPALAVLKAKGGTCRRPLGDPGNAGFRFCGEPTIPSKSYCEDCARRLYARYSDVPPSIRKAPQDGMRIAKVEARTC